MGQEGYPPTYNFVDAEGDMVPDDGIYLRRCQDSMMLSPRLTVRGYRQTVEGDIEFWATCVEGNVYYITSNGHPLTLLSSRLYFVYLQVLLYFMPFVAALLLRHFIQKNTLVGESLTLMLPSTSTDIPTSSRLVRNYGVIDLPVRRRQNRQSRRR